jgi:AdoMet-dependent heme synthase
MSEYVPAGRGTRHLALPPEILRDVVNQWIEMRREYTGRMRIIWHDCRVALLVPPEEQSWYSGCGAGRLAARIRVDGTLIPCVFLPNPAGNLKVAPFRDIWANSSVHQRGLSNWGWLPACGSMPVVPSTGSIIRNWRW